MARVAWKNRDNLPYAWRVLNHGVCDGCSLGPYGLRDNVISGTHLCLTRLNLLRLNTMPAVADEHFQDIEKLRSMPNEELHRLGRIPYPMVLRRGDKGFSRLTWEQALELIADVMTPIAPDRMGFFATSRGLTNEAYYTFQKLPRMLGTNNVDLCARLCHAASVYGLKQTLGVGAPTCSLSDFIGTELLILFGTDLANNQPVTTKYMHYAKRAGTKILVVNPYREPGLERYWIPSVAASAIGGTALADHWFDVHTGGDLAFLVGVFRALVEANGVDEAFVRDCTEGFAAARDRALASNWDVLERDSGATRARMRDFARLLIDRPNTVIVWSMGLTQHTHGVETIKALMNVGLARGLPGKPNRGLVPIRGHSGVQGGAEVGCVPKLDPAAMGRYEAAWGFPYPAAPGWTTSEMIDHAADGGVDLFWIVGG